MTTSSEQALTPTRRPKVYTRLQGVIADRVSQLLEAHDEIGALSLDEELALARVTAEEIVVMYDAVATDAEKNPDDSNKRALRQSCAIATRSAMNDVAAITEKAARVTQLRLAMDDAVRAAVERVVKQVVHSAFHVFGDDPRVLELEGHLKNALRPSMYGLGGDALTPGGDALDKQLAAMDQSIPPYEGRQDDAGTFDERDSGDGRSGGEAEDVDDA